jgi:hypothetical protein
MGVFELPSPRNAQNVIKEMEKIGFGFSVDFLGFFLRH